MTNNTTLYLDREASSAYFTLLLGKTICRAWNNYGTCLFLGFGTYHNDLQLLNEEQHYITDQGNFILELEGKWEYVNPNGLKKRAEALLTTDNGLQLFEGKRLFQITQLAQSATFDFEDGSKIVVRSNDAGFINLYLNIRAQIILYDTVRACFTLRL